MQMQEDRAVIPILLCIDVEPDPRLIDPVARVDWLGFEVAVPLIEELRPKMEAVTGRPAHVTWFMRMDPQITHVYGYPGWVADRYRSHFDSFVAAGDELGIHLHPWKWDDDKSAWKQDFADQSWVTHCVETAFTAFEKAFGTSCRAFRFGDRWMNNETMHLVERLGATSDSTIEPGRVGTETPDEYIGTFQDYSDVPRYPYRPSRADFMSPKPEPLLDIVVVPVQSAPASWASTPPVGTSAAIDAEYEGTLDATTMIEIAGWVWDRKNPGHFVDIEIVCDGEVLATVGATGIRDDLAHAGKGDGNHAFVLATPTYLKDGRPHDITAQVVGTDFKLSGAPRVLQGLAEPDTDTVTIYLDCDPLTFGLLIDRLLDEPSTALLTLKVRSDFGSDQKRKASVRTNVEHLIAHPMAGQFEFITTSELVRRL